MPQTIGALIALVGAPGLGATIQAFGSTLLGGAIFNVAIGTALSMQSQPIKTVTFYVGGTETRRVTASSGQALQRRRSRPGQR